ncbi:hypothetical protein DFH11DRAFT_844938 [Phellopilus nigrolimitatus]|nr:hypothetical protein DFH11DRAFT_844938 [Phellopilus nigrolimitatus]
MESLKDHADSQQPLTTSPESCEQGPPAGRLVTSPQDLEARQTSKCLYHPDILLMVFADCLPVDLTFASRTTSPLNFSQVRRYWRHLVLSCPSLWASFFIETPHPPLLPSTEQTRLDDDANGTNLDVNFATVSAAWVLWLHRSANAPLHITTRDIEAHTLTRLEQVKERRRRSMFFKEATTRFVATILDHHERWNIVELRLEGGAPSSLEESHRRLAIVGDISQSTQLRSLHLWGDVQLAPCSSILPHLQTVNIDDNTRSTSSLDLYLSLMRCAPFLEFAKFRVFTVSHEVLQRNPPIYLRRLRQLILKPWENEHRADIIGQVFEALTLPSLEKLIIEIPRIATSSVHTWWSFERFMHRSRPPLQSFLMASQIMDSAQGGESEECLIRALRMLPSLEVILVHGALHISQNSSNALRLRSETNSDICPLLRSITLQYGDRRETPVTSLEEMILSRWRCGNRVLQDISIDNSAMMDRAIEHEGFIARESIVQCIAEGLRVRVDS